MPGLDPGIHAKVPLANASTGVLARGVSMDHRIKSGGDESESDVTVACHSSGAKKRRENDVAHPPP